MYDGRGYVEKSLFSLSFALNLKLLKDISLKSVELYLGLGHGVVEQNCSIKWHLWW